MAKRSVWVCPECKEVVTLYVRATEVACANKHARTPMAQKDKQTANS